MKQNNNKFEILTSQGFKDFEALIPFTASEFYRIEFENGYKIEVTINHIFFDQNGNQIKVSQLIPGYQLIPNMKVSKIQLINNEEKRFINVNSVKSSKEEYLTSEGLIHHNCGGKCIVGSSIVTIRNNKTNIIQDITIQQLYYIYPYIFKETKNNKNYLEILTPSGWSKFQGIEKTCNKQILTIKTKYSHISGTPEHKVKLNSGEFIQISKLKKGDILYGNDKVIQIINKNKFEDVYDAINVELGNQFYANDIVVSNCIMLSTPRGVGNTFYRLFTEAQQGRNKFNPIILPWYLHPERDQKWRDQQTKELGQKQSAREYDCKFLTSGDTVINNDILQKLEKELITEPIQKMHHDELWIWKFAQQEKNYILSADVARGDGSDFSAFHIISIEDNQQVAEFKGKLPTTDFGELIVRIAKIYNNALVIVENASIGWAVLQEIINQGYKNLYYHKRDYKYIDPQLHSRIKQNKSSQKQKDIVGFTTSSRTRPLIIERMITILENREFIIHSKRLLNQFWTFIWLNGKQQAMSGYNDDLIMALAIGIWVRNTSYILKKEAMKFAKTRLLNINSGLNLKYEEENKFSSGFFNSSNYYNKTNPNTIDIGSETIDLNEFYFNNKKEKDVK